MEDYPANLIEFEDRFRTEVECRAYLENIRWPDGFVVPSVEISQDGQREGVGFGSARVVTTRRP